MNDVSHAQASPSRPQPQASWTLADAPSLAGKVVVVTGANSGIGLEASVAFAKLGARVVMACRNANKADDAAARVRGARPGAEVDVERLDLASLDSVRAFAERIHAKYKHIDVLVNNAGVMALPYQKTVDGFEIQFGVNHLGHFALTGLLLPLLARAKEARVVNVSSVAHRFGKMRWSDLQWENGYRKWGAYGQSKLANLLFTKELKSKLEDKYPHIVAVACHPGYAATNLQAAGAKEEKSSLGEAVMGWGNRLFAQSAEMGALPTVYAAVAEGVESGDFIGPRGPLQMSGSPRKVTAKAHAYSSEDAKRLWGISVALSGVDY